MNSTPSKNLFRGNLYQFVSILAIAALGSVASAQRTGGIAVPHARGGGGPQRHVSHQIPFPFIDKTIKFHVLQLPKAHFIEMGALWSVIPKGYAGKVLHDQQVILLNYGYKAGGIVRVFETPSVPGISAEAFIRMVNKDGFVHNVKRGDWLVKAVPMKGIFVVPTTQSKEALDLAIKELSSR